MTQHYPCYSAAGSPRRLGRQHGEQVADKIRAFLDYLAGSLKLSTQEMRSRALRFRELFASTCPRLLDEIGGLAEGAGITEADALAVQIRGELGPATQFSPAFNRDTRIRVAGSKALRRGPENRAASGDGACTTFVIGRSGTKRGTILIGQTSDTPAEIEQFAYVLHLIPDDRPEILLWTFGGMIGYHGVNSRGVAHFANSLGGGPAWRFALPHYPLKRLFLECTQVCDALGVMQNVPVCSNGNYVLCDGEGAILDVELTSGGPFVLDKSVEGFLVHSNHFLCTAHACAENFGKSPADSFPRLDRMRTLIQSRFGSITLDDMKALLADHDGFPTSICRHPHDGPGDAMLPNTGKTVAALIAEPEEGRLHVARGNPCENSFVEHRLNRSH